MADGTTDRVFGAISSTTAQVYGDARAAGLALDIWADAAGETMTRSPVGFAPIGVTPGALIDFPSHREIVGADWLQAAPATSPRHSGFEQSAIVSGIRRSLDLVLAMIAAALLLPLILIISVVIKARDGGPILFGQERIGLGGRRFRCWKFRSMVQGADAKLAALLASDATLRQEWELNHKLKNDPRTTAFGRFLRRTSLDELPQFFNIIRGDMSIVGPRPIVDSEIKYYDRWFRYYVSVKPGLTGLWQVSGRNDVSYRRRVAMDRFFCSSLTPSLYMFILLSTLPAVLQRRGSY